MSPWESTQGYSYERTGLCLTPGAIQSVVSSCVSVSCLLSIQDNINQTLKWHIGVVESQCWAACGGSWYWAHRTPSQPVMSWEHDRAGPSPQEVWDTLVSQFLGSFMGQLRPQGPYGHHGWKFVYQDMICLGREGGWSLKGEGAKSLFLNGLLLSAICTGIQVKVINHCQAVRIRQ